MPTINNETVIGSGYVTYRNARPQLLDNGWIVVAVYNSSATRLQFRVKKTPTGIWEDLAFLTTSGVLSWSLAVKGNRIFATLHSSASSATSFLNFDATIVSSSTTLSATAIDSTSQSGTFKGEDLMLNDAGTEIYHAFSAKTSSINAYNLRYMKGTIATDGTVTWGSAENVTTFASETNKLFAVDPAIFLYKGTVNIVVAQNSVQSVGTGWNSGGKAITIFRRNADFSNASEFVNVAWSWKHIVNRNSSTEILALPDSILVPKSINGFANDRIWFTWQEKDTTDTSTFNIFTSYTDDGGVTIQTPIKQTSGNLYTQTTPMLTADKNGKVFLTWDSIENASGTNVTVTAYKVFTTSWGTRLTYTGDDHYSASPLFDQQFRLAMVKPPVIRWYASGVRYTGEYYFGPFISPGSSALGNKSNASVLSYTLTAESGTTVTSIVEKVNGTTVNTYSNPASLSRTFTIPLANWDALKYYNTHTISVTVTDSNGMANTQVYSFNKALANDASLLEGAKAAKDGKDRISTKRDGIAGQVGLPPGSTFDAISAAISNNTMKVAIGTVTASSGSPYPISVTGLAFQPKIVTWFTAGGARIGTYISPSYTGAPDNRHVSQASTSADNSSSYGLGNQTIITSNGFTFGTWLGASITYTYIALG